MREAVDLGAKLVPGAEGGNIGFLSAGAEGSFVYRTGREAVLAAMQSGAQNIFFQDVQPVL